MACFAVAHADPPGKQPDYHHAYAPPFHCCCGPPANDAPDLRLCEMASDWVRQIEEDYEVVGIYLSPVSGMLYHGLSLGTGTLTGVRRVQEDGLGRGTTQVSGPACCRMNTG